VLPACRRSLLRAEGRARHIGKDASEPATGGARIRQSRFINIVVDGHGRAHEVMIRWRASTIKADNN
jgi:hypothetical protein